MDEMQAIFNDPRLCIHNYTDDVVNSIKDLNILDLMNVKCWCKLLNNTIVAYVSTLDIARGAGLTRIKTDYRRSIGKDDLAPPLVGGQFLQFEEIRWDRLEQYYFEAVEEMRLNNDPMFRFLMPFNREWMLLEAALGIVNKCNSITAKKFRNRVMSYIAEYIKNVNYQYYSDIINAMKKENRELREKLESSNTERLLLMSIISEDPDRYRK